jgi:hypothetical protein
MDKKTLSQKLLDVSRSINYLKKDKKNKMQGYSYLSEAKIKEVFKNAFEEHGIIFNYSTDEVREYEISPTSRGTKQFCTIAKGTYSFIDTDSDQEIIGTWHGSGTDTGDKGLYKAITGGIKYVLNTNTLIPTGDDPENDDTGSDNGSGKEKTKTKKQTPKPKSKTWKVDNQPYTEGRIKNLMLDKHNGSKKDASLEWDMFETLDKDDQIEFIKELAREVAA